MRYIFRGGAKKCATSMTYRVSLKEGKIGYHKAESSCGGNSLIPDGRLLVYRELCSRALFNSSTFRLRSSKRTRNVASPSGSWSAKEFSLLKSERSFKWRTNASSNWVI